MLKKMKKIDEMELEFPPEMQRVLSALAQKNRQKIVTLLIKSDKLSFSELMEKTKLESSTLNFHLKKLSQASLIDNIYSKPDDTDRAYSYYKLTEFGTDFCKALGLIE